MARVGAEGDPPEVEGTPGRVISLDPPRPSQGLDLDKPHFIRPEVFLEEMKGVIGQEDLKPRLAASFSHYTGFLDDPAVGKPVLLVFGPTGSGKTWAVEICAK